MQTTTKEGNTMANNFKAAQARHDAAEDPRFAAEDDRESLIDYLYQQEEVREDALQDAVTRVMEGENVAGVYVADCVASRVALSSSPLRTSVESIAAGAEGIAATKDLQANIRSAVEFDCEKELDEIASLYVIEHLDGKRDSEAVRNAMEG
jgi:hypothetical protein